MNRFLPFAITILMTAACSREKTTLAASGMQPPASAAQVETVTLSPIVDEYRASGTVRARYTAAIAAKIAANILEIRVQTGDRVIAGQTLIVNFPGSPKSIDQLFGVLAPTLKHVVRTLSGDSSHHESDRTG